MSTRVNHREPLHRGRVFNMDRENVSLENGVTIDMDIIRHPGAAAIVPLIDSGRSVILIRQYRHAVGEYIWEIPAGTLDSGETPLGCARRELIEETGYAADTWEKLGEVVPVPGYADERIHLFSADGLRRAEQHLDADEILDVHEMQLDRVLKMVDAGEIQDAKTLTALFLLTRRRQGGAG